MNKLKTAAIVLGVLAGLIGAFHGLGEMLQGNIAPKETSFEAWPQLATLSGFPATTIIPSLLVAGILTIIIGVFIAVWASKFFTRRTDGLFLIPLSVLLLMVGGGIVPPLFGIAGGLIATVNNYIIVKNGDDKS